MNLSMHRADSTNSHFAALEREWAFQIKNLDDVVDDYESPHIEHARKIVNEIPVDRRYGIYVLRDEAASDDGGYVGMVHVNHAWIGTSQATLRMLWVLLAPQFDYMEPNPLEIGTIAAGLLYGGIKLCQTDHRSKSMKMHLGSLVDRQYASALVASLRREIPGITSSIRGNWLQLDNL